MISDKVILDLAGNSFIQQHMRGESVKRIKIHHTSSASPFKLEVISEKGFTTICDLNDQRCSQLLSPAFAKAHYFIIKRDTEGYSFSFHLRGLLGGGNGSSKGPKVEKSVKAEIRRMMHYDPSEALKRSIEVKSLELVQECMNEKADPNAFVECRIDGELKRERIFFYAIHQKCSPDILNLMAPTFQQSKSVGNMPAIYELVFRNRMCLKETLRAPYDSTIKILLENGAIPDENTSEQNIFYLALASHNYGAAKLLASTPGFNPHAPDNTIKGYTILKTLFMHTHKTESQRKSYKEIVMIILANDKLDLTNYFAIPLRIAIELGWDDVLSILLSKYPLEDLPTAIDKACVLKTAFVENKKEALKILINHGAYIHDSADIDGEGRYYGIYSPLLEAEKRGWSDVSALIQEKRKTQPCIEEKVEVVEVIDAEGKVIEQLANLAEIKAMQAAEVAAWERSKAIENGTTTVESPPLMYLQQPSYYPHVMNADGGSQGVNMAGYQQPMNIGGMPQTGNMVGYQQPYALPSQAMNYSTDPNGMSTTSYQPY